MVRDDDGREGGKRGEKTTEVEGSKECRVGVLGESYASYCMTYVL